MGLGRMGYLQRGYRGLHSGCTMARGGNRVGVLVAAAMTTLKGYCEYCSLA
jgi:hypothetical protein